MFDVVRPASAIVADISPIEMPLRMLPYHRAQVSKREAVVKAYSIPSSLQRRNAHGSILDVYVVQNTAQGE